MKPVRTREDCIDWVTLEEVELEVFAAFTGAQKHALEFDFEGHHAGGPGEPPLKFIEGTVVPVSEPGEPYHGQAYHDRGQFLGVLLTGIVWRLEALAASKGVDLSTYDREFGTPTYAPTVQEALADQTYLGKYLGGKVFTITKKAMAALPAAERKALKESLRTGKPVVTKSVGKGGAPALPSPQKRTPARVTSTPGAMTNVERTNDDEPNCRT